MKLLKTSEYAIRVLAQMARDETERQSVSTLHQALGIPYKYLGRLMRNLAEAGLVNAERGKTGGYTLARSPHSIYLIDIVEAVEGLQDFEHCILGFANCSSEDPCPLHARWGGHRNAIKQMLSDVSLEELAREFGDDSCGE